MGKFCIVKLRVEEDADPIVLKGEHIGNGIIKFNKKALSFEYLLHQIGNDIILVSRTEQNPCEECDDGKSNKENPTKPSSSKRLDCGSMVLTSDDSCVQIIMDMENGNLNMMEFIRGERKL
mmetsp:Transcript_6208/g.9543  ORF Transcript_6208/g.9543 Transcript_6208/m.9543 type:complete len:121 (-) Transcript_6208:64-426(-)